MSRLEESKKQRLARRRLLERELEKQKRKLIRLGARRIILFGSFASGRIRRWSDLDLLVIMPSTRSSKEWTKVVAGDTESKVAHDLLVFSEDELEENLPPSSFLRDVLQKGVVIYEA